MDLYQNYCWYFHGEPCVRPYYPNLNLYAPSSSNCAKNFLYELQLNVLNDPDQYFHNVELENLNVENTN